MDFVDDVDLVFAMARREADRLIDLPDVVDAAVGGAVDLNYVERLASGDVLARRASAARLRGGVERLAVERFGKKAGKCCKARGKG